MAVCRWLYANAKLESDRKDYFVRICDPELEACRGILIELSNRLLSADKRRKETGKQVCWFAGYIHAGIYLIAAGESQEELLGISKGRYREQYCVLGYGFTGADICLMQKNDRIFEPLKEIMRDIQRTGTESGMDYGRKLDISAYRMHLEDLQERPGMEKKNENYNICPSTPETDGKLWKESLKRPVMLGIISAEDGKRLLRFFPDGIVTVLENVTMRCDAETQAVHLQQGTISRPKNSAAKPMQQAGRGKACQKDNHSGINTKACREIKSKTALENEKKPQADRKETGSMEHRLQELKKQKYREQMSLIRYWAYWCRSHLPDAQVEAVQKIVEDMKAEAKWNGKSSGFFRQSEYCAYMLLWHDKKKRSREQEIYFLIESWADTMNVNKNVRLAELIKRINDHKYGKDN